MRVRPPPLFALSGGDSWLEKGLCGTYFSSIRLRMRNADVNQSRNTEFYQEHAKRGTILFFITCNTPEFGTRVVRNAEYNCSWTMRIVELHTFWTIDDDHQRVWRPKCLWLEWWLVMIEREKATHESKEYNLPISANYYATGEFQAGEKGVRVNFSWGEIIGKYAFWFGSFYLQYKVCALSLTTLSLSRNFALSPSPTTHLSYRSTRGYWFKPSL